jgi:hypothetical protein
MKAALRLLAQTRSGPIIRTRRLPRIFVGAESASWLGGVLSAHVVHAKADQAEVVPIIRVTPRDE